jgi:membrane-associated phospholipid phosphatase
MKLDRLNSTPLRLLQKPVTALLLAIGMMLILQVSKVERWDTLLWATLFFLCLDVHKDQGDTSWLRFLPMGILMLVGPYYIYKHAGDWWWKIAEWQMNSVRHYFNWDQAFARIPFNDPGFIARTFPSAWLTEKLKWVYNFGFGFAIWGAVIRSFAARDWRKMLHYLLATHILQTPLIIPFYNTIELHEVWWVLGRADAFVRPTFMDAYHLKLNAQNCMPSMHTSIAFAVLLLALREKGPIFKYGMAAYCGAIIFSTLYLNIHWTLDVVAGLAFGYGVVKLSDWIMVNVRKWTGAGQKPADAVDSLSTAL